MKLLLHGDKPLQQLATALGVSHWNLRDWKRCYGPPVPVRSAETLEAELRALRDILKNVGLLAEPSPNASRAGPPWPPNTPWPIAAPPSACPAPATTPWRTRPPSARQQADQTLSQRLCQVHTASRQTYGSPRLLAARCQQGHRTSRRRVGGLAMAGHLASTPVTAALTQARHQRRPAAGCVHHTDRGSQHASATYRQHVGAAGLLPSMSRRATATPTPRWNPFWGRLKTELVHRREFASRAEARLAIFECVEVFYNQVRLHSALGDMSPVDFEN